MVSRGLLACECYMRVHITRAKVAFELLHKMDILGCKSGKRIPKLKALIKTTPGFTYIGTRRQTKSSKDGLQAVLLNI